MHGYRRSKFGAVFLSDWTKFLKRNMRRTRENIEAELKAMPEIEAEPKRRKKQKRRYG
jgi:hypothetical protein